MCRLLSVVVVVVVVVSRCARIVVIDIILVVDIIDIVIVIVILVVVVVVIDIIVIVINITLIVTDILLHLLCFGLRRTALALTLVQLHVRLRWQLALLHGFADMMQEFSSLLLRPIRCIRTRRNRLLRAAIAKQGHIALVGREVLL